MLQEIKDNPWISTKGENPYPPLGKIINVKFLDGTYGSGIYNGDWFEPNPSSFVEMQSCGNRKCERNELVFHKQVVAWQLVSVPLGYQLKLKRVSAGVSLKEIADHLQKDWQTIKGIESGDLFPVQEVQKSMESYYYSKIKSQQGTY